MPEAGANYTPRPLTDVEADPVTEAFAALLRLTKGHVQAGLGVTFDGLTAHIAVGQAVVVTDGSDSNPRSAYYVKFTAQVDKLMVDDATNYFFLTATADIVVNQSGTDPADSIPLGSVPVAGGVAGAFTSLQSTTVKISALLKALGLDLTNGELTNLGAPTAPTSAARLQDIADNLLGIKTPVRAATTANITLSGLQTVDGVALASQDRVLVKNQSTSSQNGIYAALTGAWTRVTDFDAAGDVRGGVLIPVSEGTVNGGAVYGLDTDDPITLGTTSLAFSRRDVLAHEALTTAHGAVSAPTPSTMMVRDGSGRSQVASPSAAGDIARKDTVDTVQTALDSHTDTESAPIHGSTSSATASKLVHRNGAGRAKFVAGAAAGDALIFGQAASQDTAGTLEALIVKQASESFALTGDISPSSLSADQDDYSPTGLATASVLRLTSSADVSITGIQGGADGRLLALINIGSNKIRLRHENTSSSAANRFTLAAGTNMVLGAGECAIVQYDSTTSRWRLVSRTIREGLSIVSKTGAYTVTVFDNRMRIEANGTFTISFNAGDSYFSGFEVTIVNVGTGIITLAGTTGKGNKLAAQYLAAIVYSNGTTIHATGELTT